MESELSTKTEEIRRLTDQLNTVSNQVANLQSQEDEIRRLTDELNTVSNQVANLKSQLNSKEEEITSLTGQNNNLQRRSRGHLDGITELENELRSLRRSTDQRNNLQQRNRDPDWVVKRTEIHIRTDQPLGEGAWGIVYRGTFRACDVAVKAMYLVIMSDHNRQSFEREAEMALRRRCLLQFIGATTDERPLIITEIMDCSLRTRLYNKNDPRLSEQEITTISLDVARGLNYLHQKKNPIVHNDISSGNVLLWRHGQQWRAKVSDYGTTKFVRQSSVEYAGAANYSAPELLNQNAENPPSCKVSTLEG